MNKPSPVLALAFAEDAMALASWAEAQGFPDDAERMREFARKVRPVMGAGRWAAREVIHAS